MHKIKLYPNATMRRELERLFNYRRFCWNQALETWNAMYDASLVMADKTLRPNERKCGTNWSGTKPIGSTNSQPEFCSLL